MVSAVDAWVAVIDELLAKVPPVMTRRVTPAAVRRVAQLLDQAARASALEPGDCECRTGGHRAGCRRAS